MVSSRSPRDVDAPDSDDGLSGTLWPVHLKPLEDELLSSWLVRLSQAHGVRLHTFCDLAWRRKPIWNRDIDRSADKEILGALVERTATPWGRAWETTLVAYEGSLFEHHNPCGNTNWILPVGVYHRVRRRYGLQYCPGCLRSDIDPYFRRRWRLAFVTTCAKHRNRLLDRCPTCGAPVNFHRAYQKGTSITACSSCGFDLRSARAHRVLARKDVSCMSLQASWLDAIRCAHIRLPNIGNVDSLLFFRGQRVLIRLLYSPRSRERAFVHEAAMRSGLPLLQPGTERGVNDFEHLDLAQRHLGMTYLAYLAEDWPTNFIAVARNARLTRAHAVADRSDIPFWLERSAFDLLRSGSHPLGELEFQRIRHYLDSKPDKSAPWHQSLVRLMRNATRKRRCQPVDGQQSRNATEMSGTMQTSAAKALHAEE